MSDKPGKPDGPEDDAAAAARTVFMPAGDAVVEPSSTPVSGAEEEWFSASDADGPDAPRTEAATVFDPQPLSSGWDAPRPSDPPLEAPAWSAEPARPPEVAPAPQGGRVAVGSVLNNIYEVRRFIARGGMGEVYEGVNTHTDERVAIKVILSHLADDQNVQAMFRKEARTLTRLSHPALVQYRVLAQEPQLRAFYIVTEYIDGAQLGDVIGRIQPSEPELEKLIRRLAAGLNAAHELGAIHRDMSPDNVLLPGGRLADAKIIDFGIAKDLDPSNKTIVGDGFAGKLGFVAPEQFGDYGREIGAWTDVYSLALVILSVAQGRPVDMGATLVDAIDRRRAGPDLSAVPERLRPVFAGMLEPDPAKRFRSMGEVLEALDQSKAAGHGSGPVVASSAQRRAADAPSGRKPSAAVLAGGGLAAAAVAAGAVFLFTRDGEPAQPASSGDAAVAAAVDGPSRSEAVRRAVEAVLPSVSCTWIDVEAVSEGPAGVSLRLAGVAGSPAEAQETITSAARAAGAQLELVDASDVFPIGRAVCPALDGFRTFRQTTSERGRAFSSQQSSWELSADNPPCVGPNAKAVVTLGLETPTTDFSLVGMESSGALQQLFKDRSAFDAFAAEVPEFVTRTGGGSYRSTVCNNETGLVGQLLVTGQRPFDLDLPDAQTTNQGRTVDAAWLARFAEQARAKNWRTEMVWYRVVDDTPG